MIKSKIFNWVNGAFAVIGLFTLAVAFVPPPKPARAQLAAAQTWAGTATGTVNAAVISVHNVGALGDLLAVPINFFPSGANTGTTTVTITLDSGGALGPVNILRPVPGAGLTAFLGGEFQSTKIATIQYDGTQFECTSCASFTPPGFEQDYSGLVIPTGWLKEDGSAISRTTFPGLFNATTFATTANTTNTNTSVLVPSSATYQIGWFVGGANVVCNSTITSIPDGTHIVINNGASSTGATNLTIGPSPQGDCSTTFNLPNRIGRTTAMVDGSTNITSTTCTNAGTLGSNCGGQTQTLTAAQIPSITFSGTGSGTGSGSGSATVNSTVADIVRSTFGTTSLNASTGGSLGAFSSASGNQTQTITSTGGVTVSVSTSDTVSGSSTNTSGAAHPILMPVSLVYKLIKT